ncbi:MAG: hypothetical protein JWR26_4003 [Pedosphaera sp.]|nr:hypothetical protein [Pedosphaera sp.]
MREDLVVFFGRLRQMLDQLLAADRVLILSTRLFLTILNRLGTGAKPNHTKGY